ncbi:MAG: hypothetical protein ACRDKF_01990 [Actinomycetota bacterium]
MADSTPTRIPKPHDMRATESDIAWIEELITNERSLTEIRPNTQPN